MGQLEEEISLLLDLNCGKLTDEEVSNHIMRIRRRGNGGSKELEKLLEGVGKDKSLGGSRKQTVVQTSRVSHQPQAS